MRQIVLMTAVAVGVSVMTMAAQGRNFSGTWTVDVEKTTAAAPAGGGRGGAMVSGGGGVGGGVVASGGGGGAMVARSSGGGGVGGGGGAMVASGGGGGTRATVVATDTVITLDANTFSIEVGGTKTSYPTNGTETLVDIRGMSARAVAKWQGDVLTISTTVDGANGPMTSTQSWSMEGDSLVRETTRKTYYKRK